jgi:DNA-binding NarL/FixJ family response regulator
MIHDNRTEVAPGRIKSDHVHELLNELAEARSRLDRALIDGAEQRRRMAAACTALEKTMQVVRRNQAALADTPSPYLKGAHLNEHPGAKASPARTEHLKLLTPREIEVLRLIAEGLSTKEIAAHLNISFKTVVSHRSHLLEKLGIHESATLVRLAVRAGIVSA